MNTSRRFIGHLEALWAAGLDDAATTTTTDLFLDGIAVASIGARDAGPRVLAKLALEVRAAPVATLIGHEGRVAAIDAARANGAAMHVLDYEPMWIPPNHAVSPILPAILALAELAARGELGLGEVGDIDGQQVLLALAIGIEAQARLRLCSGQMEPADLAFDPPGLVGPLGSAVACGMLLQLDRPRLVHAIGIAASAAGTILANVGSMTKSLHCGQAAAAGLQAALLAAEGFTADADPLGGPRGYLSTYFGPDFDPDHLDDPLPRLHVVQPGPAFKLHASQYGTQFAFDAAMIARGQLPADADIRNVRVIAPLMPYVDRPTPDSGLAGKFSLQYCAALGLLDGKIDAGSFADARRFAPDMVALLSLTTLEVDRTRRGRFDQMSLDLVVETTEGLLVHGRSTGPPGIWGRPAPAGALDVKLRDCLSAAFGSAHADRLLIRGRDVASFDVVNLLEFLVDTGRE